MNMAVEKIIIPKGKEETLFLESASSASYAITLANGAKAEIVIANAAPADADVAINADVKIGKNAELKLIGCALGGRETRSEVRISQQAGSRCEHFEVALLSGSQRLIARTTHLHAGQGSFSRSSFRFAAAGSSHVDVQGSVEIGKNAAGADAHFVAKSLLLSREAIVKVVPMLSVKTGDVKAGHGAAMAPVSLDELFYLESRGIEGNEGRRMILEGFLLELEARQMDGIRAAVAKKIGDVYGV